MTVDLMLLGVAAVSLAVALMAGAIAWRLARDERARSEARVAALRAAAAEGHAPPARVSPVPARPSATGNALPPSWTFPAGAARLAAGARGAARGLDLAHRTAPDAGELTHPSGLPAAGLRDSFLAATNTVPANRRQRWLAAVAGGLLVILAGSVAWTFMGSGEASRAADAAPLELVSLRHERQGPRLAVSGLVRNPVGGHPVVEPLSAVVFLFDQSGAFVTSAQTAVDFLKLGPGDESPFVVQMDAPASVTRYRVSFRTGEGMLPHVDRREQPPVSPALVELDRPAGRR